MRIPQQFAHERVGVGDSPGLGVEDQDAVFGGLEEPPITNLRVQQRRLGYHKFLVQLLLAQIGDQQAESLQRQHAEGKQCRERGPVLAAIAGLHFVPAFSPHSATSRSTRPGRLLPGNRPGYILSPSHRHLEQVRQARIAVQKHAIAIQQGDSLLHRFDQQPVRDGRRLPACKRSRRLWRHDRIDQAVANGLEAASASSRRLRNRPFSS